MTKVYFKQKRKEKSCAGLLLANAQRARNSANGVSKDQTEEEELNNSKVETCSSSPQANQEISSEDRNSHHPDIASSSSATTCRSSNCFNMDEGILTRDVEMDFSDDIPTFSHNRFSNPVFPPTPSRNSFSTPRVRIISNVEQIPQIKMLRLTIERLKNEKNEISEEIQKQNDAFAVFSEEIQIVRHENITIRASNSSLQMEVCNIRTIVSGIEGRLVRSCADVKKSGKAMVLSLQRHAEEVENLKKSAFKVKFSNLRNKSCIKNRFRKALHLLQHEICLEDDVGQFIRKFTKFLNSEENQSYKNKLSNFEAVDFLSKCGLSLSQMEKIKNYLTNAIGYDLLPSVKNARDLPIQLSMISSFKVSTSFDNKGKVITIVQCMKIAEVLAYRIELLCNSNQFVDDGYTKGVINIGVVGDAGGGSTKLALVIGNVSRPNSSRHVMVIAVYDGSDNYSSLKKFIPDVLEQLGKLTKIRYLDKGVQKTAKIVQIATGDCKFQSDILGHQGHSSHNFCFKCFAQNPRGAEERMKIKDMNVDETFHPRTIDLYKACCENGDLGVRKGCTPLLPHVAIMFYLIPLLHIIMGIFDKYIFNPLWKYSDTLDNTTSFPILKTRKATLKNAVNLIKSAEEKYQGATGKMKLESHAELKALQSEKLLLDTIVNGTPEGTLEKMGQCWAKFGADKQAWFQSFCGNHLKLLLTPAVVEETFNIFGPNLCPMLLGLKSAMGKLSTIMSLSGNKFLNDSDVLILQNSIRGFVEDLKVAVPEETIILKLHLVVYHAPQMAKDVRNIGRITEPGVESVHAIFNALERRFCNYRDKKRRYIHVLRELMCRNIMNDMTMNTSIPGLSIVPKDATVLPISSQNDLRDPKVVIRDVTAAQKRKNLAKKKINFSSKKRLPQSTKSRNAVPDFSQNVQTSIAFGGNSTKIGFRGLPSNALSRPNPMAITQTCSTSQPITRSHPLVAPPVSYQLPKCSNSLAEESVKKIRASCGQARRSAAESSSTESHVDTNSKKKVYRLKFVQKSREIPKKK